MSVLRLPHYISQLNAVEPIGYWGFGLVQMTGMGLDRQRSCLP